MLDSLYQSLDPVAFAIGPVEIRWYALAYLAGFLVGALVMFAVARRWRIRFDTDSLLVIMLCVMIGIIVGARLGYVLFYGAGYYLEHPLEVFALKQGGMSFHGGLIGALFSAIVAAKITHIPYLTLADLGAIAAPIGLFFGRCANFINGELWGALTDLPWGVVFGGSAGMLPRHPSQLYEAALEGVLLFIILFALARKRPPCFRGTFLGLFLVLYGICRFAIEFVRQPDAQIGYLWGGWLTMGQVLSLPLIAVGGVILVYVIRMKLPQQGLPNESEEVVYSESNGRASVLASATDQGWRRERSRIMSLEFWKCELCGNVAVKPYSGGGMLACCGQNMDLLKANSTDAAMEKHVPVVTISGDAVHVEVGSTLHPMDDDHYITFICLETQKGYQIAELSPGQEPKADFAIAAGDKAVAVYEYCNKHGLWVAEV